MNIKDDVPIQSKVKLVNGAALPPQLK